VVQSGLRIGPVKREIRSASLRAGSSLRLKNGYAQDDRAVPEVGDGQAASATVEERPLQGRVSVRGRDALQDWWSFFIRERKILGAKARL